MLTDEELAPVLSASLKEQLRRSTGVDAVRLVEKGQLHFVAHGKPVTLERTAADRLLRLLDAPEAFPVSEPPKPASSERLKSGHFG